MTYGKDGTIGRVVRTNERIDPKETLATRLRALGATEEIIGSALDAHGRPGSEDLTQTTDAELAARVGAILSGSVTEWNAATNEAIAEARMDPALWDDAKRVAAGSIPGCMKWVGTDAPRAVVLHEAELYTAEDEGREPRKTLVKFLGLIHGRSDIGIPA